MTASATQKNLLSRNIKKSNFWEKKESAYLFARIVSLPVYESEDNFFSEERNVSNRDGNRIRTELQ